MVRPAFLTLLLLATACTATGASRAAGVSDALVARERQSWELVRRKDYAAFGSLLADDFLDVFPTGRIVGKRELLDKYIRGVDLKDYALSGFHVVRLSDDAAIVVYTAVMHGIESGEQAHAGKRGALVEARVTVTSAWALRGGRWLNVFYRENDLK